MVHKVYEVTFVKNFYHLQTSFHCILLLTFSCIELFITFNKYWMLKVSSKAVKVTKMSKVRIEQGGVMCVCVCVCVCVYVSMCLSGGCIKKPYQKKETEQQAIV